MFSSYSRTAVGRLLAREQRLNIAAHLQTGRWSSELLTVKERMQGEEGREERRIKRGTRQQEREKRGKELSN